MNTENLGEATTMENDVTTGTEQWVAEILAHVLGGEAGNYTSETELFGVMPELDSLALVELITVIEERFDLELDEDDITAEVFGRLDTLAARLDARSGQ